MIKPAHVLGIDESATEEEIQAAFRDQVRRFHPDKFDPNRIDVTGIDELNPDELFRDVKQARDVLISADSETLSLQHEWDSGDPSTAVPRDDPTEQAVGPDGSDEPERDDATETEAGTEDARSGPTDGPGDDSPWNAGGANHDAGVEETIGVEIQDGSEESVSTGGGQTNTMVSRRGVLALTGIGGGGLIAANWMGLFGSNSNRGRTEDHVVVDSSETIQEAADRVSPGGTLEIPSGTYSEYLSVDVDMSVFAPEGATLSGQGADVTAITVSDADVEIEGLTLVNYGGSGIRGGGRESELSISDVTVEDMDSIGLDLTGEGIDLAEITVRNSDATGLKLTSTNTGSISVTDIVATANEDPGVGASTEGRGIVVDGGEEVVIRDSEVTGSGYENIHVESGDAKGQNVEISNTLAAGSASRSGIRIDGSYGEDEVTIQGTESFDNARGGVTLGEENEIDSAHLEGLSVADNEGTGIDISVTRTGSVSLIESEINRNIKDKSLSTEGYGLRVVGGEQIGIRDAEVTGSGYENIYAESGEARGQNVEISNTLAAGSASRSGIRIDGSYGEDIVTVENTQSNDNDSYGFDLGGESVHIVGADANGNGDGALNLRDINRDEAEIRDSF